MTERPPINKRPQMRKSSLGATIRNTGLSTRHIYEMQIKTANYEAMMQRFQLRKVSDTGIMSTRLQAKNLVIDKESGSVKKKSRHQRARFSLQRFMRSLTKRKTWRKLLRSLTSPIIPSSRVATIHRIAMLCTYHFQLFYLPFGPSYYPEGSAGVTGINIALEVIFVLNLLLNFNTAYHDQNTLVTSRKLIASNYLNKWFIVDFLSAIPRVGFQFFITGSLTGNTSVIIHSETALMVLRVLRVTFIERTILVSRVVRISKHMVAWLRYSRYSHLLGIAQLMWLVLLIAHYMACLWHVVSEKQAHQAEHVLEKYIADYYYAVSLIQGQGNIVGTRDENIYCTVAILIGSVVLAIVFGNVAMLVSNFNASSTNYHRKMEAVFATMDKMKLPDKLRDRIHQYYTHVWTEYESLDGDIVKFQRELTHTLGLEVGLYKYMNLVTEIPFWKDCSPDFATQIILNLAVRVYLPDDYVVRKGETCDEMFMINRGICARSYTWESDSDSDSDGDGGRDTGLGSMAGSTRVASLEASRLAFDNQLLLEMAIPA
ncbi:Potassium/sodium hyperpolarization-activated cyclic nucleotide-gated channel 1 [Phytophthora ramorum]|uniref:Potassium/sodium hyperpolarization-activated cyclic nucleotide-gated channel 1 n=1 Tax=Phytophthora ramorum TaxID=164328 RepID=UPI0030A6C66F|nr:Potassium/sodium hyperpolarization-activated cyclic nucleotide-gated channel 1 [Phytophthora ramorum]